MQRLRNKRLTGHHLYIPAFMKEVRDVKRQNFSSIGYVALKHADIHFIRITEIA